MMSTTSGLPQLGNDTVPKGHAVLQNMPSIICSRILEPQPGETILDMCAAPGNKTTHISALMKGTGVLVALEKNKSKILRLEQFCKNHFACKNVTIHCYDATKAVQDTIDYSGIIDENVPPPYPMESFDRVLLDGPCSGLGQRPQITNCTTEKQMASYVPLQRQLFTAVNKYKNNNNILRFFRKFDNFIFNFFVVISGSETSQSWWSCRLFYLYSNNHRERRNRCLGIKVLSMLEIIIDERTFRGIGISSRISWCNFRL